MSVEVLLRTACALGEAVVVAIGLAEAHGVLLLLLLSIKTVLLRETIRARNDALIHSHRSD